jgi:hypothetical protein
MPVALVSILSPRLRVAPRDLLDGSKCAFGAGVGEGKAEEEGEIEGELPRDELTFGERCG